MPPRCIALACLTPLPDTDELGRARMPSYGIRRIQAAVTADPECPGHVVRLFDHGRPDIVRYVGQILTFAPDILGISMYVWSTESMLAVAREVKRLRPSCLIVVGGPSARSALFDLDHYRGAKRYIDAVVEGDGEVIFRNLCRLPDLSRSALETVNGLTLPTVDGWHRTPPVAGVPDLDSIASPFELGLMPRDTVAYLETFRGCPLSCRFCEWGVHGLSQEGFSAEYIAREMRAFSRMQVPAMFLLDAGLNLNIRAFRNLRQAALETGALKHMPFWAEIYPTAIRDEHLDFLQEVGPGYLGVGLQSMDSEVLRLHQRPADPQRFEAAVHQLAAVTSMEIQVIFGLPGDTPEGFRRTLAYALSLPASVRAYHCLVLPDALLTRGLPEWEMRFDPRTLAMTSCLGWTADSITAMRAELSHKTRMAGGKNGNFWWSFPRRSLPGARAMPA